MKNQKILLYLLSIILLSSCLKPTGEKAMNPSGFLVKRGVNLSHWLSQDFGWAPKYTAINEHDLKFIDSIGYDHVRIPIDEKEMWDSSGAPNEVAFVYLTNCLDWCAKYDLRAIVDLHTVRSHHFNAENEGLANTLWTDSTAQQHFIDLWRQLSVRLKAYPNNMVAYEILNEAVAPDHNDWNKLMNKAVKAIRELEPERVLVLGPNMWQQAPNLEFLQVPENDKNIILSFHTYTPMALTHYTANWVPLKNYQGKVHYPGQIVTDADYKEFVDTANHALVNMMVDARISFDKARLTNVFAKATQIAKEKQLQLYCGEFGCLPTMARTDRLAYYSDMISAFNEYNVAWCNWEYKGDFGIYFFDNVKMESKNPDIELIQVLLQPK
jgi:endoglucanase